MADNQGAAGVLKIWQAYHGKPPASLAKSNAQWVEGRVQEMSSFTIGKRLFTGVGALVVFTFALGVAAMLSISNIGNQVALITHSIVKRQTLAHEMAKQASDLISIVRAIEVRGYMKDPAMIESYDREFRQSADEFQSNLNAIEPMLTRTEAKQAAKDMQQSLLAIQQSGDSITQLSVAGNMTAAVSTAVNALLPAQKRMEADVAVMLQAQEENLASAVTAAESSITSSRWVTGLLLALSCLRWRRSYLRSSRSQPGTADERV
jgi:C4-dicarboxylate-specific signal transduction histidine kinase